MKPVNLDNSPCAPTSSNCVIWNGPDVPCLSLCKGDTVTDVVYKLATELCTLLDTLNVDNYDLSCLSLDGCAPKTFDELIQLLVERICSCCDTTPVNPDTPSTPGDVNLFVTPAECFGLPSQLLVTDYAVYLGEQIFSILDELSLINASITSLDGRVTALETAPPPVFVLPQFTIGCNIGSLISGTTEDIDVILEEFINAVWCPISTTLGGNSDLIAAIAAQCIATTDDSIANPGVSMVASYPTYNTGATVADAVRNLWIALCDLRAREYDVVAGTGISVSSANVGGLTTFTVEAAAPVPGVNQYLNATGAVDIKTSPSPTLYHFPAGYGTLSYLNITGSDIEIEVHASFDSGKADVASSDTYSDWVDGAIVTTSGGADTVEYETFGGRSVIFIELAVGGAAGDNIQVNMIKNSALFWRGTLPAGDAVSLKFKTDASAATGFLNRAQLYVKEI